MIARVAESCFWLNRYAERVETLARMLDVNAAFQLDVDLPDAQRWRPLVIVTGQEEHFTKITPPAQVDDGEVVQEYLTWNEENASSIVSSKRRWPSTWLTSSAPRWTSRPRGSLCRARRHWSCSGGSRCSILRSAAAPFCWERSSAWSESEWRPERCAARRLAG